MTDRELLQLLADYYYARWTAAVSLLDARRYFERNEHTLAYESLLEWAMALDESKDTLVALRGMTFNAIDLLNGSRHD